MSMPPRRVLYVEGNVDGTVGGSYFSLLFLASGLDEDRYEPLVVFAADTPIEDRFHAAGIRTLVRPLPRPMRLHGRSGHALAKAHNFVRGYVIEPLRLAVLLRRECVSLVHLNNSLLKNHPWMIAARVARIPCITHERGINETFSRRARWLAKGLDGIVCISAAVRDSLIAHGVDALSLVTIHNGLDPESMRTTRPVAEIRAELGLRPDQRLLGIVGNIRFWKGQEVVVRALGLLRDEFPDVACLLVGETSRDDLTYRTRLEALIEELGLGGRVLSTGYRGDVANYIAALEIQVHASVAPEPFGRVLLEGMALSKPLVASRGGAVPEIVIHGVTGLLFEPGIPEELAAALRSLLSDPDRASAMGRAGRRRLESHFSITHNVRETQATYDSVLST